MVSGFRFRLVGGLVVSLSLLLGLAIGLSEAGVVGPGPGVAQAAPQFAGACMEGIFRVNGRPLFHCQRGTLHRCNGQFIINVGSDTGMPQSFWNSLHGKYIRACGNIEPSLPRQCAPWLNVLNPQINIQVLRNPCPGGGGGGGPNPTSTRASNIPTSTPDQSGGPGCEGRPVFTQSYNVTMSSDDAQFLTNEGYVGNRPTLALGGDHAQRPTTGLRWQNIQVPPNSQIASAFMRFIAAASSNIAADIDVYGHDTGNAPTFSGTNHPAARQRTAARRRWSIRDAWTSQREVTSADVSVPVQAVINRPDWQQGNALALILVWTGPFPEASTRLVKSFDGGSPPRLILAWCGAEETKNTPKPGAECTPDPVTGKKCPTNTPPGGCPPGQICPTPTTCPPGRECEPTATERPPCPPGQICPTPTTCPDGRECPSPTPTTFCPPGQICPTATPTCPPGRDCITPTVEATPTCPPGVVCVPPTQTPTRESKETATHTQVPPPQLTDTGTPRTRTSTSTSTPRPEPTCTSPPGQINPCPSPTPTATCTPQPGRPCPPPTPDCEDLPPSPCNNRYDVNGDGVVDETDVQVAMFFLNTQCGTPGYCQRVDVNGDCVIDTQDLMEIMAHVGETCD